MGVEPSVNVDEIEVAKPCPVDWGSMSGDERVRHCGECDLNVYNISGMSRDEAAALIAASEGERLCVRLYRRKDGTVITQDCPVGLAAFRRKVRASFAAVAGFGLMLLGLLGWQIKDDLRGPIPLPVIVDPEPDLVMGIVCPVPPPPAPPAPTAPAPTPAGG